MKRNKAFLGIAAALLYLLLLILLTIVEKQSPDGNIASIPLAVWYSLTTLTTVGYGDLYPVTLIGRIIGAIFQLMSLGVLALLIGVFVAFMRGRLLPTARLRLLRKKQWFLFPVSSQGGCAAITALAKSIYSEDRERVIIFCGEKPETIKREEKLPCIVVPLEPAALVKRKPDDRLSIFFMEENGAENELRSSVLLDKQCTLYCMTEHEPDRMPENCRYFDPFDCCARLYWRRFPLRSPDEKIILIGSGKFAEAILSCGLELNVTETEMRTQYVVFGSFDNFLRDHYRLRDFITLNETNPHQESLSFSDASWNADPELLCSASRILFCFDNESETIEKLTEQKRYFPVSCPVHAKLSLPFDGVFSFGSTEELYSSELVLRSGLNETAVRLNEIYRNSVNGNAPTWGELSSFTRRSNIASAEHLRIKLRILLGDDAIGEGPITRELCQKAYIAFSSADEMKREDYRRIEHERWMRFHFMNNWRYAEKRDNAARCHPLLVPYDRLSRANQLKDDYAWELLKSLSDG